MLSPMWPHNHSTGSSALLFHGYTINISHGTSQLMHGSNITLSLVITHKHDPLHPHCFNKCVFVWLIVQAAIVTATRPFVNNRLHIVTKWAHVSFHRSHPACWCVYWLKQTLLKILNMQNIFLKRYGFELLSSKSCCNFLQSDHFPAACCSMDAFINWSHSFLMTRDILDRSN